MQKVYLYFSDLGRLADFVLTHRIDGVEVKPGEQSLSAVLSEEEVKIASFQYGAKVIKNKYSFLQE